MQKVGSVLQRVVGCGGVTLCEKHRLGLASSSLPQLTLLAAMRWVFLPAVCSTGSLPALAARRVSSPGTWIKPELEPPDPRHGARAVVVAAPGTLMGLRVLRGLLGVGLGCPGVLWDPGSGVLQGSGLRVPWGYLGVWGCSGDAASVCSPRESCRHWGVGWGQTERAPPCTLPCGVGTRGLRGPRPGSPGPAPARGGVSGGQTRGCALPQQTSGGAGPGAAGAVLGGGSSGPRANSSPARLHPRWSDPPRLSRSSAPVIILLRIILLLLSLLLLSLSFSSGPPLPPRPSRRGPSPASRRTRLRRCPRRCPLLPGPGAQVRLRHPAALTPRPRTRQLCRGDGARERISLEFGAAVGRGARAVGGGLRAGLPSLGCSRHPAPAIPGPR